MACGPRFSAKAITVAATLIVSKALFKALESPFVPFICASLNPKNKKLMLLLEVVAFHSRLGFSWQNFPEKNILELRICKRLKKDRACVQ